MQENDAVVRSEPALGDQTDEPRHRLAAIDRVEVVAGYAGARYGLPTDGMRRAVELVARLEGILLDPVYSGKAMAGLIGLIAEGRFKASDRVVFLHSGGTPALFAYRSVFEGQEPGD